MSFEEQIADLTKPLTKNTYLEWLEGVNSVKCMLSYLEATDAITKELIHILENSATADNLAKQLSNFIKERKEFSKFLDDQWNPETSTFKGFNRIEL